MNLFTIALMLALTIAPEAGKAVGSFTYDGNTVTLAHAVEARAESLFDSSKQDLIVVLSDKPLGATAPGDDVELSLRARKGDLGALMLRIDGAKLVNVSVFHKGLAGKVLLPGAWFDYQASKLGAGTLKLAARDFDGHKYAATAEFVSIAAPKGAAASPAPATAPPPAAAKPAEKPLPPATTSNIDTKSANALLVQAVMEKDERRALEIIKLGADPNGKDQYGVPMLSWAVMMCQPQVVQALVDRKANVNYSRAPGMTVLAEAGACPAAQKILKAAGAK